jgi:hypothetical protein
MRGRRDFLLEEPSMKNLLEGLLPRLIPGWVQGEHFLYVPHEGKTDLDRSVPRKLSAWRVPGDRFIVLRGNDNADCREIKVRLVKLCAVSGRADTLIRLVCQELESWYLGDLVALADAYQDPKLGAPALQKRFAVPDSWAKPSTELRRMVPAFQKGGGARRMGAALRVADENRSHSFRVFVAGVRRIALDLGWQPDPSTGASG